MSIILARYASYGKGPARLRPYPYWVNSPVPADYCVPNTYTNYRPAFSKAPHPLTIAAMANYVAAAPTAMTVTSTIRGEQMISGRAQTKLSLSTWICHFILLLVSLPIYRYFHELVNLEWSWAVVITLNVIGNDACITIIRTIHILDLPVCAV